MKHFISLLFIVIFNHFGFSQFSMNINKIGVAITCEDKIPLGIIAYKPGEEVDYEDLEMSFTNFHVDSLFGPNYKLDEFGGLATIESMMEYQENVVCIDTNMFKMHLKDFDDYVLILFHVVSAPHSPDKIYEIGPKYGLRIIQTYDENDVIMTRNNELTRIVLEWRNGKGWEENFWREMLK